MRLNQGKGTHSRFREARKEKELESLCEWVQGTLNFKTVSPRLEGPELFVWIKMVRQ